MEYITDEEGRFCLPALVRFSQCDATGRLSLCELLRLASDAGVEDYRLRGLPREKLSEAGFAILVSRTSFRLYRLPREGECVTLATVEEAPEALLLVRSYQLLGEGGEVLASGVGKWIVVDVPSRRIIPTAKFAMRKPSAIKREHDCLPAGKISKIADIKKVCERKISWSDLDANGHTNNSRYAEFVMDALGLCNTLGQGEEAEPSDATASNITDFRINFNQEATLGKTLSLYMGRDAKRIYVEGRLEEGEKPQVSFEAEIVTASICSG